MSDRNSALPKRRSLWQLALQAVKDGGPSMCQFAITTSCNASCGFCNFAVDKLPMAQRQSVTLAQAQEAAEILHRNGCHFLIYVGGEPMMHPHLNEIIAHAYWDWPGPHVGHQWCACSLLPEWMNLLMPGLVSAIISVDAADAEKHEQNRGLKEVCDRIREANVQFRARNIGTTASVTMSRLVDDYQQLPPFPSNPWGLTALIFPTP